jgi:hypothetical protein
MGLLDQFNMDDPKTMGLLSAAGAMFNASGPSLMPHSFGQVANAGLQGYTQGYRGQYTQSQLEQINQLEMLSKKVGLQQAMARLGFLKDASGQDNQAPDSQPAGPQLRTDIPPDTPQGFTAPADRYIQSADPSRAVQPGGNRQLRALYGLAMADGKLDTAYNIKKDMITGFARDAGKYYIDPATGAQTYMSDPTKGIGFDPTTKTVTPLNGFNQVNADIKGAETDATMRATNRNTLAPLDRINPVTGRPYSMTTAQLIDSMSRAPGDGDRFGSLPPSTQAAIRGDQSANPGGSATFNFAGPGGGRIQGDVPSANGFNGFAGPADTARMAASVKQQMEPRTAYDTAAATNMADYEKGLNGRVSSGQDLMMRINESRDALSKFQAGGGMEVRQNLAKTAQAFGAPQSLVDRIAGGDLSAAQEFQKLSAQQAMEALKQAMGGSGRISQAEFKVFQQNNPNLDTDPRAIEKVFNFATKVYQRDKSEQDALSGYKRIPGADITAFPNWWAGQSGVPAQQMTGAALGTPSPSAQPAGRSKVVTLADIAATARASGRSTKQVTADMRAAGYTIGGQ